MLRDKIIRAVEIVFLGPATIVLVLVAIAVVTAVLMFLLPAALAALGWALYAALMFFVNFFLQPSLLKVWGVICFLAACVLVYKWADKPDLPLPLPRVRRGRPVDDNQQARKRAVDAIHRRREALRRHQTQ